MKGFLLLAAIHILIIYQAHKKGTKQSNKIVAKQTMPAPMPAPVQKMNAVRGAAQKNSLLRKGSLNYLATTAWTRKIN